MHRKHSLALISSAKARNTPNNLYSTNVASSSSPAVGKLRCKNQKRSYSELSITHTDTSNTCILLSRRPEQCISRLKAYNIQSRDAQCSRFYSSGVRVSSTYKAYDGRREFATKPKRVKPPRSDSYAANRTILVSPWRGPPTFLHALAFVREIEAKYGKVWWAGLEKDRANPYEYKPRIVVIFEDAKSVSKIPGFAFRSVNEPMDADVSPSSSRGGETGATTLTPLFIPWSDTLHKAAYRKGGPALENVLAFLEKKTLQPSPEISAAGSTTQVSLSGLENSSVSTAIPQQASWSEFDEAVSIDAVLKPWTSDRGECFWFLFGDKHDYYILY
ncbi:hypothetical protein FRC15_010542 [Serendipita sp. 397]|nr:hypothetical protein FRC15_010542 [Serendipita sp. 397]